MALLEFVLGLDGLLSWRFRVALIELVDVIFIVHLHHQANILMPRILKKRIHAVVRDRGARDEGPAYIFIIRHRARLVLVFN